MKTSSAKSKGRELQKFLANYFTELFDLEEGDIVSRSMGSAGEDLMFSPKARSKFPVSIEAKSTTVTPGTAALKQAKANAKDFPALVIWKPRGVGPNKSRVIMELEDFTKFVNNFQKKLQTLEDKIESLCYEIDSSDERL